MHIDIITVLPELLDSPLNHSILKRAKEKGLVEINVHDLRDYSLDQRHRRVDDYPYGGGAGMLLMIQPIYDCLKAIKTENSVVCLISPQGQTYNQKLCHQRSIFCGMQA